MTLNTTTLSIHHRWRAALRIEQHLRLRRRQSAPEFLADLGWDRLLDAATRLRHAYRRGWMTACRQVFPTLVRASSLVRHQLERYEQAVEAFLRPTAAVSVPEIYADLLALEQEFDRVQLNLRERVLTVETGPITLEGYSLGPFTIRLAWERIGDSYPYEIAAVTPNPAASDSSVVHPHVRDRTLCEGEGQSAIREALLGGRLYEFCLLVRQILETYNEDNAYVSLDHWSGESCVDCGDVVAGNPECPRCQSTVCWDCASSCDICHETCCSECRERCPECEALVCSGCISDCDDCGASRCSGCLSEGKCAECVPEPEPEDLPDEVPLEETAPSTTPALAAHAAVHADRVGQAPVPA